MIAVGGLILALICFATVGLAAGIVFATRTGRTPAHWLLPVVRLVALAVAAWCLLLAALHQLVEALT